MRVLNKRISKLAGRFVVAAVIASLFGVMGWRRVTATPGLGQVEVFFDPAEVNFPGSGIVAVRVNSGDETVGFVRLEVAFDKTKVRLVSDPVVTGSLDNVIEKSATESANSTGLMVLALGLSVEKRSTPPVGDFEVARFEFEPVDVSVGGESVGQLTSGSQVVSMAALEMEVLPGELLLKNNIISTPTPTVSVTGPGAKLTWNPAQVSTDLNQEFEVGVVLESVEPVVGVDMVLNFDASRIEIVRVEDANLFGGNFFSIVDSNAGIIRASKVANVNQSFGGLGTVVKIVARSKVIGESVLGWEYETGTESESNVISERSGGDILENPTDLTVVATHDVSLIVKVLTYGNQHEVAGTISDQDSGAVVSFQTDATGTSGEITWNGGVAGAESDLSVKIPAYLRRKRSVQLLAGENTIDFGQLVGGDLNDDGEINTMDLARLYSSWFDDGAADLNVDGVTNSADYWLLTGNFLQQDE